MQQKNDQTGNFIDMDKMQMSEHGGDRYRNEVLLDFSVNTNPLGMPDWIKTKIENALQADTRLYEWYPDPFCEQVRARLALHHDIPKEHILCGNGASELICAAVRAAAVLKDGRHPSAALYCVLPVPSFGEYERALLAVQAEIDYHMLSEKNDYRLTESLFGALRPDTDLLIMADPNNPTGNLIPEALLTQICTRCRENGTIVLLDECFLELTFGAEPERSFSFLKTYPNVILLKAFTKAYAMAGLRFGYCMCADTELLQNISRQLPCWNVSGIAQLAALTVLDNEKRIDYISQTKELLLQERTYLETELKALGMRVLSGRASFICFYDSQQQIDIYEALLAHKILIRDCDSYQGMRKGWYRIAVRTHEENVNLIQHLRMILKA